MALSNYRAYYKRTYYANGEWHTDEEETECCQLNSAQSYPDGYYRAYRENMPLTGGLSGITINSIGDACYAAYSPGKIFMPKKYFTLNDLFNPADIAFLWTFIESTMNTVVNEQPNEYFQKGYNYHSKNHVFWKNELGHYIVPYISLYLSYSKYYYTWQNSISLSYLVTSISPDRLYSRWENGLGGFYYLDEDGIEQQPSSSKGTYISNGNLLKGAMHDHPTNVPSSPKFGEVEGYYKKYMEQLSKVRFHVLYNNNGEQMNTQTNDGNYYFSKKASYGQNKFIFLCDLMNVPYLPTGGFIILGQNGVPNFLSTITSNGGPDPNDPYEEDDPYEDEDDDEEDDTDDDIPVPDIPTLSATGASLITVYNPNSSQLESIAEKLWSPDFLDAFKQWFTSPMEAILGLAIVPVKPSTASSRSVYFGRYNTEVQAPLVDSDYVIVDCGSVVIMPKWDSYLDYDPYTKISCYLPYIGEVNINPDQVMGKSLGIRYYVNVVTGDTVAILTVDESVFMTAAGNCIRQLPIAQQDYSAIINTAITAVGALAIGIATGAAGAASVGAVSARKKVSKETIKSASAHAASANVASGAALLGNVTSAKNHYQHNGQIGTGSGHLAPQKPYITIERPNLDLADRYKSFVGYPCNKTLSLGSCHGYTQIEATRLSVPSATDEEIAEILEILTEGVII